MQIADGLDRFVTQLEADGRSVHTIGQYRRHVRLFARWCRDVRHGGAVGDVGHEDIARFLSSPVAHTRPDGARKLESSVNALRSSLRGFFGYLHRAGDIALDPTRLTRRALCGQSPPRGLSDDERQRLLDVLAEGEGPEARRDHLLFHVMLTTGIRLGAAVAINVEDVDVVHGEIELRHGKGNRPARVFLGQAIREHLDEYLCDLVSGPLFPGRDGEPITPRHVHRRLRQWLKKAGINRPVSPHTLRHAFAMGLYQRTGDILLVKEALHHRSIASTLIYARADEERLRRALA